MMTMLDKYSPKYKKESLFRFYLSSRMFSWLSKLFLKEFITSKNMMMQFGQVYLEYLQCLDKAGLIAYRRDGWYKFNGSLKMGLKMVSMFLEKCIKSANEGVLKGEKDLKEGNFQVKANAPKAIKQCKTVLKQSSVLKLKIIINEGRVLDAIKLFQ